MVNCGYRRHFANCADALGKPFIGHANLGMLSPARLPNMLNSPLTKSFGADFVLSSSFGGELAMAMGRSDGVQDDLMATWAGCRGRRAMRYDRLQDLLGEAGFDAFVEQMCKPYYAARMGAPSLPPGRYFRMHMIGYFEGIDSERGIAWRCADLFSLCDFLGLSNREAVPIIPGCRGPVRICRTRRTRRLSASC